MISFHDIPVLMEYGETLMPQNRAVYEKLFDAFLRIYKNNRSLLRWLNRG